MILIYDPMVREQTGSYFDHVAIAVHRWEDAYAYFVEGLGGRWVVGGDAGDFQPAQLKFAGGAKLEFVQPGPGPDGFLRRFVEQHGPSPHHLTFRVADLDSFGETCLEFGYATFAGRDLPEHGHRELFVHPKVTGFGTLLQAVTLGPDYDNGQPPPAGFPTPGERPHVVEWVAWGVPDPTRVAALLVAATGAAVVSQDDSTAMLEWDGRNRLLVLAGQPGIHHVLFRTPEAPVPAIADTIARAERAERVLGTRLLFAGDEARPGAA